MLGSFLLIFRHNIKWPKQQNHWKNLGFLMIFTFWLLGCCDDLMIEFWLVFDRFGGRKSTKNRSKIDPKNDRKQDASWDGFWIALGSIFDRFWAQVGGQVGAKLAPKSEKKMMPRRCQKNTWNQEAQERPGAPGSRPRRGFFTLIWYILGPNLVDFGSILGDNTSSNSSAGRTCRRHGGGIARRATGSGAPAGVQLCWATF